jgi:cysteine synthase A
MEIREGFIGAIGNTPLIKLRRASELTGCNILGKAEFLNPGGSVKDRAALYIVKDAEERGLLSPGGVIVEGTAGNTGIGLALVGNARGYRTVIVMPETQSQEKKDMLLLCGADLRLVPAVPYANPMHYARYSGTLAEEIAAQEPKGAIWANQFDNLANRRGHYETTGPEIWEQTDGKVDGFVCSVGTGGTLSGVGIALRERNPGVKIYLADPMGSGIYSWYARREWKPEGNSITEGIGNNHELGNIVGFAPDGQYQITDEEMLPVLFSLAQDEGLILGGSTGINVCGAIRLARELGQGHTIVTILADSGTRYQSKLFNPDFLRSKHLPVPDWLDTPAKEKR